MTKVQTISHLLIIVSLSVSYAKVPSNVTKVRYQLEEKVIARMYDGILSTKLIPASMFKPVTINSGSTCTKDVDYCIHSVGDMPAEVPLLGHCNRTIRCTDECTSFRQVAQPVTAQDSQSKLTARENVRQQGLDKSTYVLEISAASTRLEQRLVNTVLCLFVLSGNSQSFLYSLTFLEVPFLEMVTGDDDTIKLKLEVEAEVMVEVQKPIGSPRIRAKLDLTKNNQIAILVRAASWV